VILARGAKSDDVKAIQVALRSLGYYPIPSLIDGDFGPKTEAGVKLFQASRKLPATGIVDAATSTALLRPASSAPAPQIAADDAKLEAAGRAVVAAMVKLWDLDVYNPKSTDQSEHARRSRAAIDGILTRTRWGSYVPWDGRFRYCGLTAGDAYIEAGFDPEIVAHYFSSTYRLDLLPRYKSFDEKHPNPKPTDGRQRRLLVELTQASTSIPIVPRAGDIITIGDGNPACGDHVCVVDHYDDELHVFHTIEGNGTGTGPDGKPRSGIVRGVRHIGGPGYCVRRLIRLAPSDIVVR
jgi:peptidoglycan hydrolase-like protein with peptidoglycan-binding domain